jgi:hypothetical protein
MIWCAKYQERVTPGAEHHHDRCPAGVHASVLTPKSAALILEWHDRLVDSGQCCAFGEGQRCCIDELLEGAHV